MGEQKAKLRITVTKYIQEIEWFNDGRGEVPTKFKTYFRYSFMLGRERVVSDKDWPTQSQTIIHANMAAQSISAGDIHFTFNEVKL